MAVTGPIPKRSDQRRRRNLPAPGQEVTKVSASGRVKPLPASTGWHKIARSWYRSLAASAQSEFYEPSDWAQAQLVAESMTRLLEDEKFQAATLSAVMAGMTELLTSEGARRRARLEIEREKPADNRRTALAVVAEYDRQFG